MNYAIQAVIMKRHSILLTAVLCALLFSCKSSPPSPPLPPSPPSVASQEIEARKRFADRMEDEYRVAFRVLMSAQGEQKDILDISVMEEVSLYDASGVIELYSTDKLKKDAKALKFKQIRIKGGSRSFTAPDTINRTIDLR